jgi:hypothetical protein
MSQTSQVLIHLAEPGLAISPDSSTVSLFEWASFLNISFNPKLQYPVRFDPGYIGIQTTAALLPGETILSAPNQAMFSCKHTQHPALEAIYQSTPELFSLPDKAHEENRFLVFFLWELAKGTASTWMVYLNFLPREIDTLVDWNEDELKMLQDTDLAFNARHNREKDFRNYTAIRNVLIRFTEMFCEEDISLEKFHWAWKAISTRSYSGKIPYMTMIPIADLFNHANVVTNFFYGTDEEASPDADDKKIEDSGQDDDDPGVDQGRALQLSSLKLYRLSLGPTTSMTESQLKSNNEILKVAKMQDQKVFLQSNIINRNESGFKRCRKFGCWRRG